jgi:hemerythrin-like domain-containing protein
MKPRGMLMIEHRLIEKMLALAGRELERMDETGRADPVFIDTIVDFVRTYADRTHHGKEEDILFSALARRPLSGDDGKRMTELIEEHKTARKVVGELVDANRAYVKGDAGGLETIKTRISFLIHFYPEHIRKEDEAFFPDTEAYFTPAELNEMVDAFHEFDRKMIHEKYTKLFNSLKTRYA